VESRGENTISVYIRADNEVTTPKSIVFPFQKCELLFLDIDVLIGMSGNGCTAYIKLWLFG